MDSKPIQMYLGNENNNDQGKDQENVNQQSNLKNVEQNIHQAVLPVVPQKKTHDTQANKMDLGKEQNNDLEVQSKDQENFNQQISNIKNVEQKKKVDEKLVDLLVKEFDIDRFRATNILKKHDGNIKTTIRFLLNN